MIPDDLNPKKSENNNLEHVNCNDDINKRKK